MISNVAVIFCDSGNLYDEGRILLTTLHQLFTYQSAKPLCVPWYGQHTTHGIMVNSDLQTQSKKIEPEGTCSATNTTEVNLSEDLLCDDVKYGAKNITFTEEVDIFTYDLLLFFLLVPLVRNLVVICPSQLMLTFKQLAFEQYNFLSPLLAF